MKRIIPELSSVYFSIIFFAILFVFLNVEKKTVVVMNSHCQFLNSEQRMHINYFEGNFKYVNFVNKMVYY